MHAHSFNADNNPHKYFCLVGCNRSGQCLAAPNFSFFYLSFPRHPSDAYQWDKTWLNLAVCPWQLPHRSMCSPTERHTHYFSSRPHRRFRAEQDPPSLMSVIPEQSPGHAMFIRLPQTAVQSVAPDECCVHAGEQTVYTDWSTWFWITSNFPICLGLKIGQALVFHSWIESSRVVAHKGLQSWQISGLFASNIVQKSRFCV